MLLLMIHPFHFKTTKFEGFENNSSVQMVSCKDLGLMEDQTVEQI